MGSIECEVDGRCFSVSAAPDLIVVDFPDLQTLLGAARKTGPGVSLRSRLRHAGEVLTRTENRLDLRIKGRSVGSLGFGVRSGIYSLLGLGHFRLTLAAFLRSLT